jgi:hypothetical protein
MNLEDGAGEVMLGLRVAMAARNSATTLTTSQVLEGVASAGGKVELIIGAANGAGVGFGAGAAAGLASSPSMCAGN